MKVWVTGLNHRTAPVSVREQLAFSEAELPAAVDALCSAPGIEEAVILSTCNRVEVAVAAEDELDPRAEVLRFLSQARSVDLKFLQPHLYQFAGAEAIRHLFRVAASLDSMVVGEPQILGQLKQAYAAAREKGAVSGVLDAVLTKAFSVAKRVRTETDIGVAAVSVSYAAVELAREIFGSLKNRRVMLIGAGKMSELAARHLYRSGAQILVVNRTESRARDLASLVHGSVVPYEEFVTHLKEVDIVITSSAAPHYLLDKDGMKRVIEARRNRLMFLIDIAVPRNIEPSVNELANIFLYDIDDLQKVVDENLKSRLDEAEEADRIVTEEVERLELSLRTRSVGPLIASLQEQLERVRQSELERMRGKLGALTPQQEQALDQLTRSIINKIAHGPISELKRHAGTPASAPIVESIRSMFRLAVEEPEHAKLRGE